MKMQIHGSPSFSRIEIELAPGESLYAEADAMSSMAAELEMTAEFSGGFFPGLAKKMFGGESLFINRFTNTTDRPKTLTLAQATPGDIREWTLKNSSICLQPGAYVCSTPGVRLGLRWAGFKSWIAREGLFKLMISGTGTLCFGAYGGLVERQLDGEHIVDSSHLVAYHPDLKLQIQLAGGVFSSLLGGEGFVTRLEGTGTYFIQTRSLDGLVGWLNPKLR